MRTVKFRAWNKETQTMHEDILHPDNWSFSFLNQDIFEWLQYTGLNDKNGNEIYEMDILQLPNSVRVIEVYKYCLWFIDKHSNNKFPISMLTDDTLNSLEIIGNIHTNQS